MRCCFSTISCERYCYPTGYAVTIASEHDVDLTTEAGTFEKSAVFEFIRTESISTDGKKRVDTGRQSA